LGNDLMLSLLIQSIGPASKLLEEQTCDRRTNRKPSDSSSNRKWIREERPEQKGETGVCRSNDYVEADDEAQCPPATLPVRETGLRSFLPRDAQLDLEVRVMTNNLAR
jgi:Mn-containing catalase